MIITIGREYGSGGKYIGERLAQELNLKFYDKEILQRLSKEENIDIKLLEKTDETSKNSFWYTLAMASMSTADSVNSLTDLPMNDKYFIATTRLIEKIAKEDNCVIIGRCSNIILKNVPKAIHIFVYSSDEDFKRKRKIEFEGINEKNAIRIMQKKDKERAAYYHYYTNEKWGERNGYHLLIDTAKLGIDGSIEMIKQWIKQFEK